MRAISDFAQRADECLQLRRALGFKLNHHGRALPKFVAYLDAIGASTLTADDAITWAGLPPGVRPVWLSQRLGVVRGFARYLQAFDPATKFLRWASGDRTAAARFRTSTRRRRCCACSQRRENSSCCTRLRTPAI
jgi:hypothetical protein